MSRAHTLAPGVVASVLTTVFAATPSIQAGTLYTESNFTGPVGTSRLALVHQELHRPQTALAWSPGGAPSGPHQQELEYSDALDFDTYTLFGVDGAGGIFVSFADPAAALGTPFETVFPGFSEQALVDALHNNPDGQLVAAFTQALTDTPGVIAEIDVPSTVVHFSEGAAFGTFVASFEPIPAPATALAMALGGMCTVRRRRRG